MDKDVYADTSPREKLRKLVFITLIFGGAVVLPLMSVAQWSGSINMMALFANPLSVLHEFAQFFG